MPCSLVGINRLRRILPLPKRQFISRYIASRVGRDSSVGIATRYGLDGPGIESNTPAGPGLEAGIWTASTGRNIEVNF